MLSVRERFKALLITRKETTTITSLSKSIGISRASLSNYLRDTGRFNQEKIDAALAKHLKAINSQDVASTRRFLQVWQPMPL